MLYEERFSFSVTPGWQRIIGFSYQKARAIIGLSQTLVENKLSFTDMEELLNEEMIGHLVKIRGIGRWSTEYVLLRGFGRLDIFPKEKYSIMKGGEKVCVMNVVAVVPPLL